MRDVCHGLGDSVAPLAEFGHRTVLGLEIDVATNKLAKILDDHSITQADLCAAVDALAIAGFRNLIGGPPCQDFSLAGAQAGWSGPCARVFICILLWASLYKVRQNILENAPPVLNDPCHANILLLLVKEMELKMKTRFYTAASCGPQHRKRAVMVITPESRLRPHTAPPQFLQNPRLLKELGIPLSFRQS